MKPELKEQFALKRTLALFIKWITCQHKHFGYLF